MEKIPYHKIIALGFTEEVCHDSVYFNEFGFDYAIISFNVTKKYRFYGQKKRNFAKCNAMTKKKMCLQL